MTTPMTDQPADLPEGIVALLGPHLGRQRWFAGDEDGPAGGVEVLASRVLWQEGADGARLWWVIVGADGARYQILVGDRPGDRPVDALSGRDDALLGVVDSRLLYDATIDPELAVRVLEIITGGREVAERVRPVSAEQSNTSLVYDDRIILKLFRRLADGPNPDVVTTTALAAAGFPHVAAPVASWQEDGTDLAFAQEFLAGGSEGWALALTSLRDLYNAASDDPAEAGGDFAGEASRLGVMTAQMHLAMAESFGVDPDRLAAGGYATLVDDVAARLDGAADLLGDLAGRIPTVLDRLRSVTTPGPALRVHGDYHLGQVMRTDTGWYVLDFEGEPARPVAERVAPASPAKDVTGMLRSFHYATRFALRERSEAELDELARRGQRWESHNRQAFLDGYRGTPGIDDLLPVERLPVLAAYELDKALYELAYERSYRPDWVDIPTDAVVRLVSELSE
jgi:maltokinase